MNFKKQENNVYGISKYILHFFASYKIKFNKNFVDKS